MIKFQGREQTADSYFSISSRLYNEILT